MVHEFDSIGLREIDEYAAVHGGTARQIVVAGAQAFASYILSNRWKRVVALFELAQHRSAVMGTDINKEKGIPLVFDGLATTLDFKNSIEVKGLGLCVVGLKFFQERVGFDLEIRVFLGQRFGGLVPTKICVGEGNGQENGRNQNQEWTIFHGLIVGAVVVAGPLGDPTTEGFYLGRTKW